MRDVTKDDSEPVRRRRPMRAFSRVEILVVVAILAIMGITIALSLVIIT